MTSSTLNTLAAVACHEPPVAKAVDPVCGMEVDTAKTPYKSVYKGRVYYFCSAHCKRAFEASPETYLREGPKGMPS